MLCVVIDDARFVTTEYEGYSKIEAYTVFKQYQIKGEPIRLFIGGREVW